MTTGDMMQKAPVKLSPSTNQHPALYRPGALPVAHHTVSKHCNSNKITPFMTTPGQPR